MAKKKEKESLIVGAEITDDHFIIIEFNKKLFPHTTKCIFAPETLFSLAVEADIPPRDDENEFPGLPLVEGLIRVEEYDPQGEGKKKG